MKTYKLTRPFDDGKVVHPRGAILTLKEAPKSAKEISAEEIAAEKAKLSDAESAVKTAEKETLKAELLGEIKDELAEGFTVLEKAVADAEARAEKAEAEAKDAKAEAETANLKAAELEAEAANTAAAAAVTGGVDNDGKPLEEAPTGKKAPVQKAGK